MRNIIIEFGQQDIITIVVDASDSEASNAETFIESFVEKIKKNPKCENIQYSMDISFEGDKNYLYLAEAMGVKIYPEIKATLIREGPNHDYQVETVRSTSFFLNQGPTYRANNVVLAGGVLGTVPLLLHCFEKGTLPRLSPMLGSRVRTNSETLMGVTAKNDDVNYSTGIAITSSMMIILQR